MQSKIALLLLPIMFSVPMLASASIFSIASLWGEPEAVDVSYEIEQNSQTMPLLKAAVNNDPNPAKGGGDIVVVDDVALAAPLSVTGDAVSIYRPKSDQISVYEVREGDTLSQIASMFHVTSNTIRWANDLSGPIKPGQTLIILPVAGVKHTIKIGGTINDLAKMYKTDAREISLFNGIDVDAELKPGTEIIIPNGEMHVEEKKGSTKKKATAAVSGKINTSGYFIHPVPSGIKTQGIHGNNAIDVAAPIGTPLRAAAAGQAIIAKQDGGWHGGYANYVVIQHDNGTQTLYAHMNDVYVAPGTWLEQGEIIGEVGNTGNSTGPHVHFEVRGGKNPF
jgi:murein DD-endopeptidase MepM/ murein hydrolase activator NlpD